MMLRHQQIKDFFGGEMRVDAGLPLQRTDWPQNRDKTRYLQLHYPKFFHNRQHANLMCTLNSLPEQSIIVDAGLGDGLALAQCKTEKNITVGFSLHAIDKQYEKDIDGLCYSSIPNGQQAREVFEKLRGHVDLVFDTYGPGTYSDETIHALLYLGLLLRPGGNAKIIISSVHGEDVDQSPIGFVNTRKKLVDLFRDEFNLDLVITRTFIESAVEKGVVCKDFHINIHRGIDAKARVESLDELFTLINSHLGRPQRIPKTSNWGNFSGGFKIQGYAYTQDNKLQLESHPWQLAVSTVNMHYAIQDSVTVCFHLQFDEQLSCSHFSAQFSEFFAFHPETDWRILQSVADSTASIIYNDKAQEIIPCVEKACAQLQTAMVIPGVDKIDLRELNAAHGTLKIFSRDASHQPTLFKAAEPKRSADQFNNQYAYGNI